MYNGKKKKKVYGVGINDAEYEVQNFKSYIVGGDKKWRIVWECPYYKRWSGMLKRCYSERYLTINETYKECEVCEEWKFFTNFKAWMEKQDWDEKELDKDILGDGKLYSPDNCIFIPQNLNKFLIFTSKNKTKYNLPIGVTYNIQHEKYQVRVRNPFSKKSEHLGYYIDEVEARSAWCVAKLSIADTYFHLHKNENLHNAIINKIKEACGSV